MLKKDFLLPHLNKYYKIQALVSVAQANLQKLPGALFQTMGVTDKERHKAERPAGSRQLTAGSEYVGGWRQEPRGQKSEIR